MKHTLKLLGIALLLTASQCEDLFFESEESIILENGSAERIYVSTGMGDGAMNVYPDTTLPVAKPSVIEIKSGESQRFAGSPSLSDLFEEDRLPAGILSIYVFNADTLDTLGWQAFRERGKVLKRYDLTLEYLREKGAFITYP